MLLIMQSATLKGGLNKKVITSVLFAGNIANKRPLNQTFFYFIYSKKHIKHSMVHSNYLQFIKSIIVTSEAFVCQKKTVKDNLSFFPHPISIANNYGELE